MEYSSEEGWKEEEEGEGVQQRRVMERGARGRGSTEEIRGGGIFIVLVTTVSNERIWYRYSNVTRATQLCTVSNGNEETVTIF